MNEVKFDQIAFAVSNKYTTDKMLVSKPMKDKLGF